MYPVLSYNIFDCIFINQKISFKDSFNRFARLMGIQDILLVLKRDLRVWNDNGQVKSMCVVAFPAHDTCYPEADAFGHDFYSSFVRTIIDQTAFTSTGTADCMELESVYCIIINFLRNGIAFFYINGYHNYVIWGWKIFFPHMVNRQDNCGRWVLSVYL